MGLPGRKALGRFELLVELGRGGMAELFLARFSGYAGFAKLVAIKRILPHLADDKVFVELFLNEGKIAGNLSHPNICQVFELGASDGDLFLVMEYLEGVAWHELLAAIPEHDPVRVPLTAGVLAQAAEGLHHAHGQHVIHRDVSPHNLFVTVDGTCKVLDFGVAKLATDGPRTRTGVLKGKLPYMSPEQIAGEPLDPRSDVFALGVIAWESLTGARLFDRTTDFLIWKAITEEPIPALRAVRPDLPPALEAVVASALERDRTRRPATVRDFAAALGHAAGTVFPAPAIANVIRGACVAQLAARAAAIREALRDEPPDASASSTIREPADTASIAMRRDSFVVGGDARTAASTAPAMPAGRRGSGPIDVAHRSAGPSDADAGHRSAGPSDAGAGHRGSAPTEAGAGHRGSASTDADAGHRSAGPSDADAGHRSAGADADGAGHRQTARRGSGPIAAGGSARRGSGPIATGATPGTDPAFGASAARIARPASVEATSGTDPVFGASAARSAIDLAAIGRNRIPPVVPLRRRRRRGWVAPVAIIAVGIAGVAIGAVVFGRGRDHVVHEPAPPTVSERVHDQANVTVDMLRRLRDVRDGSGDGLDRLGQLIHAAQETQQELATLPATYKLDSDPPAQIYVDDKLVDTTPIRIELPAGVHHVRAVRGDGKTQTLDVTLQPGAVVTATLGW